jgi:hypothetical protein
MLRLWLCGRFAGEFDGVPVSMPASDRARALIGRLALHPGTHPRSYLAARLWVPVLLVSCLAARAHRLARLGRHDEAQETEPDRGTGTGEHRRWLPGRSRRPRPAAGRRPGRARP